MKCTWNDLKSNPSLEYLAPGDWAGCRDAHGWVLICPSDEMTYLARRDPVTSPCRITRPVCSSGFPQGQSAAPRIAPSHLGTWRSAACSPFCRGLCHLRHAPASSINSSWQPWPPSLLMSYFYFSVSTSSSYVPVGWCFLIDWKPLIFTLQTYATPEKGEEGDICHYLF